eukprot:scaffold72690_cov63-Phaeocystis_antarctica.AAC.2
MVPLLSTSHSRKRSMIRTEALNSASCNCAAALCSVPSSVPCRCCGAPPGPAPRACPSASSAILGRALTLHAFVPNDFEVPWGYCDNHKQFTRSVGCYRARGQPTVIREQDSVPGCRDEHRMHATCASHNAPVGPTHRRAIGEAVACGISPLNPFARVQFALADGTEGAELRAGEACLGQRPRLVRALHVDRARLRHEGRPLGQAAGMLLHRRALLVSRGIREGRVPPVSACPEYCRVEPLPTTCHVNGGAAAE